MCTAEYVITVQVVFVCLESGNRNGTD